MPAAAAGRTAGVLATASGPDDSRRAAAAHGDPEDLRHVLELARGRVAAIIGALARAGREDDDGPSDQGAALKAGRRWRPAIWRKTSTW